MPSRLVASSLGWILTDTMYTPLPSPGCSPYPVSSPIHICTLRFPSRHIANNAAYWACISSRTNRYEVSQPRRGKEITTTCHFSSPRPDTPFFLSARGRKEEVRCAVSGSPACQTCSLGGHLCENRGTNADPGGRWRPEDRV